jgi:adenosylcobyric acid synthase
MVPPGQPIPGDCALIVLPGSKASLADMEAMRAQAWDIDVIAHHRRGGAILGICGGYQMLGQTLSDPHGIEGAPGAVPGLGLLDCTTVLTPRKALREVAGTAWGQPFTGFEMHMGETAGPDCARPFALLDGARPDGAMSPDGRVIGSYVHGALASTDLRAALLDRLGARSDGHDHAARVDAALDAIAQTLEQHVDIDALLAIAHQGA